MNLHRPTYRAASPALALLAGTMLAGCRLSAPVFGASSAAAKENAADLFGALAARFGPVTRGPTLESIRPRYIKGSLSPSRIWNDSSVWTAIAPGERQLAVFGTPTATGFSLLVRPDAPRPAGVGESRHHMALRRIRGGEYEWSSRDELAAGVIRAPDFMDVLRAALEGGETRSDEDARTAYRATFPHTTAALGRLFSLDTLRVTALRDGSTARSYVVGMSPSRVRATFPHFADYLEKYVTPARFRVTLVDREGATWLDAAGAENRFTLRLRTRQGRLLPLAGPERAVPDSLRVRLEFSAKVLFFRVGVTDLEGTLTMVDDAQERGWDIRFQREPEWHFPLAAEHLIRSPLRRPFEGAGVHLRYSVRDSAGAQTLLLRDMRLAVKESAIVRWIGMLGNSAMTDVTRQVEYEKDRFTGDIFKAMRADFAALLAGSAEIPVTGAEVGALRTRDLLDFAPSPARGPSWKVVAPRSTRGADGGSRRW